MNVAADKAACARKTALVLNVDEARMVSALKEAGDKLNGVASEAVLDFSAVRRVDAGTLRAMAELAGVAEARAATIVLRGVNVQVYKVLKLMKLTERFLFVN